jgi:hypothetical protein
MAGTPRSTYRLTTEDKATMSWLAKQWGPVCELSHTDVIREALRRAYEDEKRFERMIASEEAKSQIQLAQGPVDEVEF